MILRMKMRIQVRTMKILRKKTQKIKELRYISIEIKRNKIVKMKAMKLIENNIIPIICIGETLEEKNNNITQNVLKNQLEESVPESSNQFNTIIAYEPIWAIGTDLTPSLEEIENAHRYIKN